VVRSREDDVDAIIGNDGFKSISVCSSIPCPRDKDRFYALFIKPSSISAGVGNNEIDITLTL
jgi:hypothetical protein